MGAGYIALRLSSSIGLLVYAARVYTSATILVAHASTAALGFALLATAAVQTVILFVAAAIELFRYAVPALCTPAAATLAETYA